MLGNKKYRYNKETLNYEEVGLSWSDKLIKPAVYFFLSILVFAFYYYLYISVFELKTPKQKYLENQYQSWHSKLEQLERRGEELDMSLEELQLRDNSVYRPVFGMNEIPEEVRNAGFGGVDRYAQYKVSDYSGILTRVVKQVDILTKKAYVQSRSFDDVIVLSDKVNEMSQSIPSIAPICTGDGAYVSSHYGYRKDPMNRVVTHHDGVDLCHSSGYPIYATGNGVVVDVGHSYYGYGNWVLIDHGFGYRTKYAHLKREMVAKGQTVKRGQQIGEMGNTGKSTGTHLHYEVIYKDRKVNPYNYFNFELSKENYMTIVNACEETKVQ